MLAEGVATRLESRTVPASPIFARYPDIYCIFSLAKSRTVPHYRDFGCR
jgi:hypothetical protein